MSLEPGYVVMVTPSRWFAGGKGLDEFRKKMLADKRLRVIVDYIQEKDAFPNVNINGGVNYFLWDRDHEGDCEITTVSPGGKMSEPLVRPLNQFDIFVRRNEAMPILAKVQKKKEETFDKRVSPLKPFGLRTFFHGSSVETKKSNIVGFWIPREENPISDYFSHYAKFCNVDRVEGFLSSVSAVSQYLCMERYRLHASCIAQRFVEYQFP
jgi:site-specific DNA-methyltransferase (adenine-specific)